MSANIPERGAREGLIPRFHRRPGGIGGLEVRKEQQNRLQRAREMAQQILDNPNTPDEIKAKAQRLTELLSKREGLARDLDGKRQSFLQEHGQDLAELRQLREQGEVIRQRLQAAREKVIAENQPTIQEMRQTTQAAREVAVDLRGYYRQRWQSQEQSATPKQK